MMEAVRQNADQTRTDDEGGRSCGVSCLYDEVVEASYKARDEKKKTKEENRQAMEDSFGESMRTGLRKNFNSEDKTRQLVARFMKLKQEGNNAYKQNKLERAKQIYESAIKLSESPEYDALSCDKRIRKLLSLFHSNLALLHSNLKEHDKAIRSANLAIALNPENLKAYLRKARAFTETGLKPEAADTYETGLMHLATLETKSIEQSCDAKADLSRCKKALEACFRKDCPDEFEIYSLPVISSCSGSKGERVIDLLQPSKEKQHPPVADMNNLLEEAGMKIIEKMKTHELLKHYVDDPRLFDVVQRLTTDPSSIAKKYEEDQGFSQVIKELMKFLKEAYSSDDSTQMEIVTKARATCDIQKVSPELPGKEQVAEQEKVKRVLANEELREILQDDSFKKLLQAFDPSNPDQTLANKFLSDPSWKHKLSLLVQHGLLGSN